MMTFTKNDQLMDKLFAELVKMRQAALSHNKRTKSLDKEPVESINGF